MDFDDIIFRMIRIDGKIFSDFIKKFVENVLKDRIPLVKVSTVLQRLVDKLSLGERPLLLCLDSGSEITADFFLFDNLEAAEVIKNEKGVLHDDRFESFGNS